MDLVLFGIQGSGKGTQAKRLVDDFGYTPFEAGAALRAIAEEESHLGSEVKSYINAGHLVPHDIIMKVVRTWIEEMPLDSPILFDGIPRDEGQKHDFDAIMTELGRDFMGIHIQLDPETAFHRIQNRAQIEGRVDDSDDVKIRRRMQIFIEKTLPIIHEYEQQGKMISIDGNATPDDVHERIKQSLQK